VISVPYVDFDLLRSLLIGCAFVAAISSMISELNVGDPKEGVPLEVLARFGELYDKLPELRINSRLLSREVKELEYVTSVVSAGWRTLRDLMERVDLRSLRKDVPYFSDEKRNFYAHAGLSKNEVEVMKEGGKILLRYSENRIPVIEKWLLRP